jgi:hypothetical protein
MRHTKSYKSLFISFRWCYMSKRFKLSLLIALWAITFFVLATIAPTSSASTGVLFHPTCLQGGDGQAFVPGVPGLPCSTATPSTSGDPSATTVATSSNSKSGPVRLTINNYSEVGFTLNLNSPERYILSVPSGESRVFIISTRAIYATTMLACHQVTQGALDISTMVTLNVPSCNAADKLVSVSITNTTNASLSIVLTGSTRTYAFPLAAGQTGSYTIPRDDYSYTYYACNDVGTGTFEARSHRTLNLSCP